jgi:hypothetical protein
MLLGTAGVGLAALLLCVTTTRAAVYLALAVQGLASSLIGPGIAAISLALVGQAALSERIASRMSSAGSFAPGRSQITILRSVSGAGGGGSVICGAGVFHPPSNSSSRDATLDARTLPITETTVLAGA